jgi:PAS domain S-box-containing protein
MRVKVSFRAKISLAMIAILLLLGVFLALIIQEVASRALYEEHRKRGASIAMHVAGRIAEPLLAMDFIRMKDLVDEVLRTSEDIQFVFVLGQQKKPLVHTFSGGFPVNLIAVNDLAAGKSSQVRLLNIQKELVYDFAVPILIGKSQLGTVRIGVSPRRIQAVIDRLIWTTLLAIGSAIGLTAIVGTLLARTITRRVRLLRRSAEEVVRGNLNIQTLPPPRHQCWEITHCQERDCPAFGKPEQRCWYLAGTLCPTCVEGDYAQKVKACEKCQVYRMGSGDEIQDLAEYFDIMALTLRTRLEDLERTQRDLQDQQQILRTIFDVAPEFLSLQDPNLHYRAVNKAFTQFFAIEESSILGGMGSDALPAEFAASDHAESRQVLQTGRPLEGERKIRGAAGERWFHLVKRPVMSPGGEVIGLLCSARDITEFKTLQERMIQSQKLESLGQLAAGVAHELNTPLGIILGYTQLLLRDFPPDSEEHETLQIMEKHCRICKRIVADLLRFSRNTESDKRLLDVNELLEQVLTVVEHTFGLERISLERRLAEDLPMIRADGEKLQQVFLNLLNNACDAIGSEGKVVLTTGYDSATDEVLLSVADSGPGIPEAIRHRIFDPFFTTKGVGKGTGLGLAVTFGIVKDHGGHIEVESHSAGEEGSGGEGVAEKKGTTITLHFPLHPPA